MSKLPLDDSDEEHVSNHILYLKSFEKWISQMIVRKTSKADGKIDPKVITTIKEGFQRSVKANADYHDGMSKVYEGTGDIALSTYHKFMSESYRALLCDNNVDKSET